MLWRKLRVPKDNKKADMDSIPYRLFSITPLIVVSK